MDCTCTHSLQQALLRLPHLLQLLCQLLSALMHCHCKHELLLEKR